jgi:hypothetical protein
MNKKARTLIETVMDMISGTLDTYEQDPHHAPASWLLENWWCTLNASLQVVPGTTEQTLEGDTENLTVKRKSEIGNQRQGSSDSLEATDHSKREKRDD